jgi:hypothetical protein
MQTRHHRINWNRTVVQCLRLDILLWLGKNTSIQVRAGIELTMSAVTKLQRQIKIVARDHAHNSFHYNVLRFYPRHFYRQRCFGFSIIGAVARNHVFAQTAVNQALCMVQRSLYPII